MKNEKGFTMVEVVASILLITIVLISLSQLIFQSNNTAKINNEKLVVINLANAFVERLQSDSNLKKQIFNSYSPKLDTLQEVNLSGIDIDNDTSTPDGIFKVNDREYKIKVSTIRNTSEENLGIINVIVTVTSLSNKTKSSVEGYIELDV